MGKKTSPPHSTTSPPSPSSPAHSTASSSSSSDFEFVVSLSPRKSSPSSTSTLCPADDLFYKGLLLPLHLSPRISMVRSLLLSNSSASSSTSNSARDSSASSASNSSDDPYHNNHNHSITGHSDDSSAARPSSVTDADHHITTSSEMTASLLQIGNIGQRRSRFSLSRFSNVFKKRDPDPVGPAPSSNSSSSVKRAKEAIRRCVNRVRPLYEKLSHKHNQPSLSPETDSTSTSTRRRSIPSRSTVSFCVKPGRRSDGEIRVPGGCSFSGNLGGPTPTAAPNGSRRSSVWSCPSSTRSSPGHSGILSRTGFHGRAGDVSTMEELQSAIQGAIAHCKNSLMQNDRVSVKPVVSQEAAAAGG